MKPEHRPVAFGIILAVICCIFLLTPFIKVIEGYTEITELRPGDSVILNGYTVTYKENGSILPGECFTSSITKMPDYTDIRLECGGREYKLRQYFSDSTLQVLRPW